VNMRAVVRGVAHFVPEKVVTNHDLSKVMDTSDEWIVERTGIRERRFIPDPSVTTSDLAFESATRLFAELGTSVGDIDMIIAATLSPDLYFPGIGTMLQARLGAPTVPALDIRAQCSGFVYGLSTADAFIRSGQAKRILLVCAEVQSPVLEMSTKGRDMAVLFGDGAASLLIEATEGERPTVVNGVRGVIDSMLGSDGTGAEVLCLKAPGTATPGFFRQQDFDSGAYHPRMDGKVVFKNAVHRMTEVTKRLLDRNGTSPSDIKLLVPHQANLRINEMVREGLGIPPERAFNNIQRYGNTTAATIPLCLSEAVREGKLVEGDLVLTVAFGAGFTWGANLLRW
jgi:3-oxoacyl-[acyl-carrier-protein] synthase III